MSDVHVSSSLLDEGLIEAFVEETHKLAPDVAPDVVVVVGDLAREGRRRQFEKAKEYPDRLQRPNTLVTMGNQTP